ncbi:MAG: 16S rRNA (cytosine(1402)-N(4))-methyltransferase RsmH, partial [Parvularculaceae bacterium]|nr:16S rRNA (cytosine(1402)-N(4))-methyltransferase RsmH [Parvularculaceae bacterium]
MTKSPHEPVMLDEALDALAPASGEFFVDATLGAGGYTRAILATSDCRVAAFDRDPTAIAGARAWAGEFAGRLTLIERPFDEIEEGLAGVGVDAIDGAVFDLGVSSMQLDEAGRGFSFRADGPLSMRMDARKPDAADVVNRGEESDLAAIFKTYGEERHARRIARAILREREEEPIATTGRLAEIVARAAPARPQDKIHPATRVFQALRIFVNDELGQLARALIAVERRLRPAGRLVVVSFHSLEDRVVRGEFVEIAERGVIEASREECFRAAAGHHHHQPNMNEFRRLFANDVN